MQFLLLFASGIATVQLKYGIKSETDTTAYLMCDAAELPDRVTF